MLRVGIISDTHSLLRPEAKVFLRGSDHIVHAGDVGDPSILDELSLLAPITAVRGNNDKGTWASRLRETELIRLRDLYLCVVHDLAALDIDPVAAGVHVVVSGHSHKPSVTHRDGVLYVNPGSAGPRRFKLPITAAELAVEGGSVSARVTELSVESAT